MGGQRRLERAQPAVQHAVGERPQRRAGERDTAGQQQARRPGRGAEEQPERRAQGGDPGPAERELVGGRDPGDDPEHRQEQRGHGEGAGERQSGGGAWRAAARSRPPGRCGRRAPPPGRSRSAPAPTRRHAPARRPAVGRASTAFAASMSPGHRRVPPRSACAASRSRIVSRPPAGSDRSVATGRTRSPPRTGPPAPRPPRPALRRRARTSRHPRRAADRRQVERHVGAVVLRDQAQLVAAPGSPVVPERTSSTARRSSQPHRPVLLGGRPQRPRRRSRRPPRTRRRRSDVAAGVQHDDAPRLGGVDVLADDQLPGPRRGLPVQVAQLVAGHVLAQRAQVHRARASGAAAARPRGGGAPGPPGDSRTGWRRGWTHTCGLARRRPRGPGEPEQVGALHRQRPDGDPAAPGRSAARSGSAPTRPVAATAPDRARPATRPSSTGE